MIRVIQFAYTHHQSEESLNLWMTKLEPTRATFGKPPIAKFGLPASASRPMLMKVKRETNLGDLRLQIKMCIHDNILPKLHRDFEVPHHMVGPIYLCMGSSGSNIFLPKKLDDDGFEHTLLSDLAQNIEMTTLSFNAHFVFKPVLPVEQFATFLTCAQKAMESPSSIAPSKPKRKYDEPFRPCPHLRALLASLNLSKYENAFVDMEVDLKMLCFLDQDRRNLAFREARLPFGVVVSLSECVQRIAEMRGGQHLIKDMNATTNRVASNVSVMIEGNVVKSDDFRCVSSTSKTAESFEPSGGVSSSKETSLESMLDVCGLNNVCLAIYSFLAESRRGRLVHFAIQTKASMDYAMKDIVHEHTAVMHKGSGRVQGGGGFGGATALNSIAVGNVGFPPHSGVHRFAIQWLFGHCNNAPRRLGQPNGSFALFSAAVGFTSASAVPTGLERTFMSSSHCKSFYVRSFNNRFQTIGTLRGSTSVPAPRGGFYNNFQTNMPNAWHKDIIGLSLDTDNGICEIWRNGVKLPHKLTQLKGMTLRPVLFMSTNGSIARSVPFPRSEEDYASFNLQMESEAVAVMKKVKGFLAGKITGKESLKILLKSGYDVQKAVESFLSKKDSSNSAPSTFKFGRSAAAEGTSIGTSVATTTMTPRPAPAFQFGKAATTAALASTTTPRPVPAFQFGKAATTGTLASTTTPRPAPAFQFGKAATTGALASTTTPRPAPAFQFGKNTTTGSLATTTPAPFPTQMKVAGSGETEGTPAHLRKKIKLKK